jgi:hypothetical protein
MAGSDTVPEQLLKDIQPGTNVAWYTAAGEVGRAVYDFGEADPVASVIAKWKSALENSDPLQVVSIDSTQQAAVMFLSPFSITAFKIFPEVT